MMQKEKGLLHKIYVFGNPAVAQDHLAILVARKLEKDFPTISFVYADPNEEIHEKEMVILDVALGIDKVSLINDLQQLETGKKVSLHDFDLAFSLQLMKKIGLVQKVCIIAIPVGYNKEKAYQEVKRYVHLTFRK